jgi:hypothetical protein
MTVANTEIPGVHLGKLLAWMDTQQVHDEPRVAAIVDWQLSTIGNPLLDLGHLRRRITGRGAAIDVAQADVALVQLGTQLVTQSLQPGSMAAETSTTRPPGSSRARETTSRAWCPCATMPSGDASATPRVGSISAPTRNWPPLLPACATAM